MKVTVGWLAPKQDLGSSEVKSTYQSLNSGSPQGLRFGYKIPGFHRWKAAHESWRISGLGSSAHRHLAILGYLIKNAGTRAPCIQLVLLKVFLPLVPYQSKCTFTIQLSHPEVFPKRNENTCIHKGSHMNVHSSFVYNNSQKQEITRMSINGRVHKQIAIHPHMEYYSRHHLEETSKVLALWKTAEPQRPHTVMIPWHSMTEETKLEWHQQISGGQGPRVEQGDYLGMVLRKLWGVMDLF